MSQAALNGVATARRKHPRGLWVLFIVEMWERYAFYTMQALLVLFLIKKVTAESPPGPGFGWEDEAAQWICGLFMGLTYLTPIVGGWLADRWLGTHRSMVIGGLIIALGQFCLAGAQMFSFENLSTVTMSSGTGPFVTFFGGLVLIILGCGFFKPCAAVMVGQLYKQDDARRDAGYTIFYMGINVGAALAGIASGYFAEGYGWHWAFASGGVGMLLGLSVYRIYRPKYLKGIGLPPHHEAEHEEDHEPTPEQIEQAKKDEYEKTRPLTRVDWDRILVIIVLTMFAGVYWVAMKQQATSLTVFAERKTDRTVTMLEPVMPDSWYEAIDPFPAPWYQSVNPIAIILFAPVFAWLWGWLDRKGWQPSTPAKFGIGLMLVGVAYLAMIAGSLKTGDPRGIELADASEAVQEVLQPVLDQLIEEKKADDAKAKAEGKQTKAGEEEEEKPGFETLEKLVIDDNTCFVVAYETRGADVYQLLSPDGKIMRRQAERKWDKDDPRERLKKRKPEEIELAAVPDQARAAIAEHLGGNKVDRVRSVVRNGEEAFEARWVDDEKGKVEVCVVGDGFLLTKRIEAYRGTGLTGPQWLVIMYIIGTFGELCVSPVGLSMVTKLSPVRYQSMMMGLYFGILFLANFGAGPVGAFGSTIGKWGSAGETFLPGQTDFFVLLAVVPIVVGLLVLVLSPKIKRMMHGVH